MGMPEEVRALFAGTHAEFGPPCSEADLLRAEAELGEPLPPQLRELYLAFDGFMSGSGAHLLWPLFAGETNLHWGGSLVDMNVDYRTDGVMDPAQTAFFRTCLLFGDDQCKRLYAYKRDMPSRVVRWDMKWPDDFDVDDLGDSPLAAWAEYKRVDDRLAAEEAAEAEPGAAADGGGT